MLAGWLLLDKVMELLRKDIFSNGFLVKDIVDFVTSEQTFWETLLKVIFFKFDLLKIKNCFKICTIKL